MPHPPVQLNLFGATVSAFTRKGTFVRQIPPSCPVRFKADVPHEECFECALASLIHFSDDKRQFICTKDVLTLKAFPLDMKEWREL